MKRIFSAWAVLAMLCCTACSSAPDKVKENAEPASETASSEAAASPAPRDKNGDILIRIATDNEEYIPLDLRTAMEAFNAADNGYHVEPVIYSKDAMSTDSSGGLQTADMRLQTDIIQGDAVDIVMDYSFTEMSRYDILTEKGAFVDLYTFLDSNAGISRDELNAHVLALHETDGQLCQIPLYFNVETLCGEAQYVGTKENWTLEELAAHWEAMPEDAFFCNNSNQWMVYDDIVRANMGAFVDYENGTCSFDSPEFVRLLEFCAGFPEAVYKVQPDWDTVFFLEYCRFDGFESFHSSIVSEDGEGTRTLVGYPSEDGNGGFLDTQWERYSICAGAHPEVQEGAWAFLSYMLDEDVQAAHNTLYEDEDGFPLNNAAFQRMAEEQLAHAGETRTVEWSGRTFEVGYLTQAEYEQLTAYIGNLNRMESPVDNVAHTIIEIEVKALFEGKCTAEEAAEAIQGRMEIMISERM